MKRRMGKRQKLEALAYADAVRDILAADGKLQLVDETTRDAVWEWDGVSWNRVPLVDRGAADQPPFVEVERDDDLALAG